MTTIYAHRGCWDPGYPENSIESFAEAGRLGFISECDVWATADGQPVVLHDATLDRTTTGSGPVAEFTAAQLRGIHCRVPGVERRFSRVPLLADVVDAVSLVEIKPPDAADLVRRIIHLMAGRTWRLQSFDPANLHCAREMDPTVPVALLVHDLAGIDIAVENRWPVHVDQALLDDRIVGRLRAAGLALGIWTVDTEAEILRALLWRPEVLVSDHPEMVRRLVPLPPRVGPSIY